MKVPDELRPIVGKREIKRTLGTADYREAVRRVRLASAEVDALFAEARRQTRQEPVRELSEHDLRQLALLWFVRHERDMARREGVHPPDGPEEYEAALESIAADEAYLGQPVADDPHVPRAVDALLKEQNVELGRGSDAYRRLCELVRRGMLEGLRRSRLSGDYAEHGGDPVFNSVGASTEPTAAVKPVSQKALTFAELVERYMGDPGRSVSDKTLRRIMPPPSARSRS